MERFEIVVLRNGRYGVIDRTNNRAVAYSYSNPPIYVDEVTDARTRGDWGNFYSACGFAQKLDRINL